MLNHITIRVTQMERSRVFFEQALKPLGYTPYRVSGEEGIVGFEEGGEEGWCDLWIRVGDVGQPHSLSCVAFTAANKEAVDQFYQAALRAGGRDNGPPGYRENYCPGYYAAFVLDPDGHNVEAVFHDRDRTTGSKGLLSPIN